MNDKGRFKKNRYGNPVYIGKEDGSPKWDIYPLGLPFHPNTSTVVNIIDPINSLKRVYESCIFTVKIRSTAEREKR
jgi:hypothetical protein